MGDIPQKIHILKFIAEQGVVTVDDVYRYFPKREKPENIRVDMYRLGVSHKKYGDIRHGIWHIDNPKLFDLLLTYFPNLPLFTVRPIHLDQVPHHLELNRIRTILERTDQVIVEKWWSENYLRALNQITRHNSKVPDAIFWRKRKDGSQQKFFLEYERTLKNKERYENIFQSYAKRQDVKDQNVLYICQNEFISNTLERIEEKFVKLGKLEGQGLYFQFLTLENLYNQFNKKPN